MDLENNKKSNRISKETRDAIKKFLTSNVSQSSVSRHFVVYKLTFIVNKG